MALKQKITKVIFDALSKDIQAEYKAAGDDYVLDVEGYEDPAELRRARDREKEESKAAKAATAALQKQLDEITAAQGDLTATNARKAGDIATLEASWKAQKEAAETLLNGTISKKDAYIKTQLVDSVAQQIASKISTVPAVILPHIRARLTADMTGDTPLTRVLDHDGKLSALSIADLEKEFVGNADFSSIIIASNGSGGGAPGGKQNGGAGAKKFAEMTGSERAEFLKRDPVGFEKESAAQRSATPQI